MTTRRTSSTIPYGYVLTGDKTLEPVEKEIKALEDAKEGVRVGAFSLRNAVELLEHETGRKLSPMGLKKIIDRDTNRPSPAKPNSLLNKNNG